MSGKNIAHASRNCNTCEKDLFSGLEKGNKIQNTKPKKKERGNVCNLFNMTTRPGKRYKKFLNTCVSNSRVRLTGTVFRRKTIKNRRELVTLATIEHETKSDATLPS